MRKGAEKLGKAVNAKQQGRLDGFFTVQTKPKEKDAKVGKGKGAKDDPKPKGTKRKVSRWRYLFHDFTLIVFSRTTRTLGALERQKQRNNVHKILITISLSRPLWGSVCIDSRIIIIFSTTALKEA